MDAESERWLLTPSSSMDVGALHELLCLPEVFRYLFDGTPPEATLAEQCVAESDDNFETFGVGLWLLEDERGMAGFVRLEPDNKQSAELTYALQPSLWGRGLATRMGWTAMEAAFERPWCDKVVAGADLANYSSLAVMERLGMTYLRDVDYPLGPGRQCVRQRGEAPPEPLPEPIQIVR